MVRVSQFDCQICRSSLMKYGLGLIILTISFFQFSCSLLPKEESKVRREVKDTNLMPQNQEVGLRKRIIILPFLDQDVTRSKSLREKAREVFIDEINRRGQVIASGSESLSSAHVNLDLTPHLKNGDYDLNEISKKAQALGALALVEGKLIDIRVRLDSDKIGIVRKLKSVYEAVVRLRIVTIRGAQEIYNTEKTVVIEQTDSRVAERVESDRQIKLNEELMEVMVRDAFLEFLPQIEIALDKVVWEGRIAGVSGDRIYLNVGKISGVQVGDLLKVSDSGEEVYDPEHGGFIGKVPGRLKGTLEVISFFGEDGCIATVHSGSGFRENDRVEVY